MSQKELKIYAKAGAVAEELISSIRTVTAFSGQKKGTLRYTKNLDAARKFGVKKGIATGAFLGSFNFIFFAIIALAFWFGGKLIREENFKGGDIVTVFFSVLIGAFSLGLVVRIAIFTKYQIYFYLSHLTLM